MRRIGVLLFLGLLTIILSANEMAEQYAQEGWNYLKINDYENALKNFEMALESDDSNSTAHLGKIFYYNMMENNGLTDEQFYALFDKNEEEINDYVQYTGLFDGTNGKNKKVEKLYKKALKNDSLNPTNRFLLLNKLASYYKNTGNLKKAAKTFDKLHSIKKWKLIGPFDNILGSGFDEEYAPENRILEYKTENGKNDIPIDWFDNTINPNHSWVYLTDVFSFDDAVFYANNFVFVPEDRDVMIHYGTSGMTKLFINDAEIVEETEKEKDCYLDQFVIKTQLKKGWNRFLVKIGYSEIGSCNFFLNITDTNGEFFDDIQISVEPEDYYPHSEMEVELKQNPYIDSLKTALSHDPGNLFNHMKLTCLYLKMNDLDMAEKQLEQALSEVPGCSMLQFNLALIYLANDKEEEGKMIVESLFKTDEMLPLAISYQIVKELDNENYDKVKEYLPKFANLTGKNEDWYDYSLQLNADLEQVDNYLKLLDKALAQYPDNLTFIRQKVALYLEKKDTYKAYTLYESYTKDHYNPDNLYIMAILSLEDRKFTSFNEYIDKMLEYNPASSSNRYRYAELIYSSFQNYTEAMETILQAIKINPTASHYYKLYADAFKASKGITLYSELNYGDVRELSSYYNNALKYNPLSYSVRRQQRELRGEKSIFSLFDEFDYKELMTEDINLENYPDKHSVIVKRNKNVIVYENGGFESESYSLIKVLKDSGCETWQELQFSSHYFESKKIEEAKVIKPDGSEIDAAVSGGNVVFKKLEPNDYIYYKLKTESYLKGIFKNQFFDDYKFNSTIPVIGSQYTLLLPKDKEFHYITKNFEMEPETLVDEDEFTKYIWKTSDSPAIEVEYAMPSVSFCRNTVEFSTVDDWGFIVDWYLDLAKNRAKISSNIEDTVEELVGGREDLTDLEKVKLVYEYITEEINYSHVPFRQSRHIPQKAKRVLSTGIGDCKDVACLSIAMLEELGLKAHYLLINTENKDPNIEYLPSLTVFNHVITAVEMGDSLFYMDLTAKNFPFGTIPDGDQNSFCLLIKPGENSPFIFNEENLYPPAIEYNSDITINKDNNAHSNVSIKYCGLKAGYIRSVFRDLSEKEINKTVKENLAAEMVNVNLEKVEFDSLDTLYHEITQRYSYSNDDSFLDTGSFKILVPPWYSTYHTSSALSYSERTYPISIWSEKHSLSEQLNISIEDQALKLVELPEDISIESKFGNYTQQFREENGMIIARRSYNVKQTWVSSEEYLEFKEFYNKLIQADKRQLLFRN